MFLATQFGSVREEDPCLAACGLVDTPCVRDRERAGLGYKEAE